MFKISNVLFNGERNMKQSFSTIAFLAWQVLNIVGSQIEVEFIFSLA
jgi:hypothetical protein